MDQGRGGFAAPNGGKLRFDSGWSSQKSVLINRFPDDRELVEALDFLRSAKDRAVGLAAVSWT